MIIGTAGHVDHGKTSLVRALTGVDTDRLKEEKARGMSIDLGFAYAPTPQGGVLGFVDVPGHERFVHNMLTGAAGIDFVLLVIAADDGVMPQTREHLAIVDLLGVEHGLVALTKIDLVASDQRRQAAAEIGDLLSSSVLAGVELVEVSPVTGEGVGTLRDRLFAAASGFRRRSSGDRFRLTVDRSFTLAGAGLVMTGTVLSGAVTVGDRVVVSPSGRTARVRSIHAQNQAADTAQAGDRCALNLVGDGIGKETVGRGDVVIDPTLHAPTARIDAELRLLAGEAGVLRPWMPAHLHHGAAEVGVHLLPLGATPSTEGERRKVQLVLDRPIAAAAGDRFILRDAAARRTLGGGRFLDLRAPQRWRGTPERLAQLASLALPSIEEVLVGLVEGPPGFVELAAFARDRALDSAEILALADRLGLIRLGGPGPVFVLSAQRWTGLSRAMISALAAHHAAHPDLQGLARTRLRATIEPPLPEPVFAAVLESLVRRGEIAIEGAWVRQAGHRARLTAEHEALYARIVPLLGGKDRFRAPRVRDIAGLLDKPELAVRQLLKLASRMGRVDEIAHDHFFLRGTLAEIVTIARAIGAGKPDGQFTAADLRDRLNNGRKVAIQILEFLDRHGVTVRRGDLRRVDPRRLDLFGHVSVSNGAGQAAEQARTKAEAAMERV